MIQLKGHVRVLRLTGKVNMIASSAGGGPLQAKTVYPSHSEQIIAPDEDFYGLALVTVKPTPRLPAFAMSVCEGNGDIFYGEVVETMAFNGVELSIGVEKWYYYFEYNGIRLPRIPDSVLRNYPYCWIRLGSNGSTYDLMLSKYPWYYSNERLYVPSSTYVWYTATVDSAEWTYSTSYTDNGDFNLGGGLKWSNHDIPNGSATATDIYFKATEPVPTD